MTYTLLTTDDAHDVVRTRFRQRHVQNVNVTAAAVTCWRSGGGGGGGGDAKIPQREVDISSWRRPDEPRLFVTATACVVRRRAGDQARRFVQAGLVRGRQATLVNNCLVW